MSNKCHSKTQKTCLAFYALRSLFLHAATATTYAITLRRSSSQTVLKPDRSSLGKSTFRIEVSSRLLFVLTSPERRSFRTPSSLSGSSALQFTASASKKPACNAKDATCSFELLICHSLRRLVALRPPYSAQMTDHLLESTGWC